MKYAGSMAMKKRVGWQFFQIFAPSYLLKNVQEAIELKPCELRFFLLGNTMNKWFSSTAFFFEPLCLALSNEAIKVNRELLLVSDSTLFKSAQLMGKLLRETGFKWKVIQTTLLFLLHKKIQICWVLMRLEASGA